MSPEISACEWGERRMQMQIESAAERHKMDFTEIEHLISRQPSQKVQSVRQFHSTPKKTPEQLHNPAVAPLRRSEESSNPAVVPLRRIDASRKKRILNRGLNVSKYYRMRPPSAVAKEAMADK
jgi:hypothetical protein